MDHSSLPSAGIPAAVPVAAEAKADDGADDAQLLSDGEADDALNTTGDTAEGDGTSDGEAGGEGPPPSKKRSLSEVDGAEGDPATAEPDAKKQKPPPRQPSVKGLAIPFRTIKRIMKLDSSLGIVQNDAAIVATAALELFVERMAKKSLELSQKKGRNTIKYDDVAEARAGDPAMSFLDLLLP
ncbi:hypothetical protein ACHAXT_008818 [Thalassiosira profunda]